MSPPVLATSVPNAQNFVESHRLLWVVRHGERVDNVNPKWRDEGALPRGHWDDPPLSPRGIIQAAEVGQHFSSRVSAPIDFLLCSPFSRCLQTAQQIVGKLGKQHAPTILIEPGFCESLNACQRTPGFLQMSEILQTFPELPIDTNYIPRFLLEDLNGCDEKTDLCCIKRVIETLQSALERQKGNLLVVSHGSPISAIHFALTGQLEYVGQCTVSHYRILSADCCRLPTTVPPFNGSISIGKSIVIRAEHLPMERSKNGEKSPPKPKSTRRDTFPRSTETSEESLEGKNTLEFTFKRLAEAATGMRLVAAAECLVVGDSSHLSDRNNLRGVFHL